MEITKNDISRLLSILETGNSYKLDNISFRFDKENYLYIDLETNWHISNITDTTLKIEINDLKKRVQFLIDNFIIFKNFIKTKNQIYRIITNNKMGDVELIKEECNLK